MQADTFFLKEMEGEHATTALLSVKGTLEDAAEKLLGKTVSAVKTEVAKDSESMESTLTGGGIEKKL
jgi:hypothetical protein